VDYAAAGGWRSEVGGRLRGGLAAIVCFLVAYSPQLAAYRIINGHFGPHASVSNKMHWWAPHGLQGLFDPQHGFFLWTPLALMAIAGVVAIGRRREGATLLLMVALQFYIGGSVESWTVAGGFGQRRLVAISTALAIGYAVLWQLARARAMRAV